MDLKINDCIVLIRDTDDSYCRIVGVVQSVEDFGTKKKPLVHTVIKTIHNGHKSNILLVNGLPYKGSYKVIRLGTIENLDDISDINELSTME